MLLFCPSCTTLATCWQVVDLQHDNKLLEQTCNKAVEFIKLVASLLQACSNLSTSWGQPVRINLATSLCPTTCYKSAAGLLEVVQSLRVQLWKLCTHGRTDILSTSCARNKLVTSLSTSCSNAVILSSCTKFVTHNLLTSCWLAAR